MVVVKYTHLRSTWKCRQIMVPELRWSLLWLSESFITSRLETFKHASFDRVTEKRRLRQGSKKCKRRRLDLKQSNSSSTNQKELRKGVTYQSSVALDVIEEDATISIPEMTLEPKIERINDIEDYIIVPFDLENIVLSDDCELTQVAVFRCDGRDSFDMNNSSWSSLHVTI